MVQLHSHTHTHYILFTLVLLQLVLPYLDLEIKYFDLGLPNRDATDDQVTIEAAEAIKVISSCLRCRLRPL